jgi:hypothetical protein
MKLDPISGPIPREKFDALVNAPHGEARNVIQQHDPFWGLPPGTKIDFEVEVCAEIIGGAIVKAASLEEAKKLADNLTRDDIEFDTYSVRECSWTVETVNPLKPAPRKTER